MDEALGFIVVIGVIVALSFIIYAIVNRIGLKDILSRLRKHNSRKQDNSDEVKKQMCEKALRSGVCPRECDICAWNTLK